VKIEIKVVQVTVCSVIHAYNSMYLRDKAEKVCSFEMGWRKLYSGQLQDFYCSSNIVQVIKLRRIRWAGHMAHMGEKRNVYRVLVEKPEGKRLPVRPEEDGRIILKWILKKWDGRAWSGLV
jgi:hypothetical protein